MSNTKFAAAKELVSEGQYDAARAVLKTINHPSATKWLARIDELDPPFPEANQTRRGRKSEQDKFYERENRKARRKALGLRIDLMLQGIGALLLWSFLTGILFGQPVSNPFGGLNLIIFLMGACLVLFGIISIFRFNRSKE